MAVFGRGLLRTSRSLSCPKEKGGRRGVKEKEGGSAGGSGSKLGEDTSSNVVKNNVGQFSTAAPNKGYVSINVTDSPATNYGLMLSGPTLYAKLVTGEPSRKSVNFRTLIAPAENRANVVISVESVRAISECVANTDYGFFLRNGCLTPLLITISKDGMDAMLENDPWFILNNPFILKNEDGLSVISTKLGTQLMLDSYTSDMCIQSWGTSNYAKAIIEFRADVELKDTIWWLCLNLLVRSSICVLFMLSMSGNLSGTPRQAAIGVHVGPKVGFKPTKQVYRPVSNKNSSSTSDKKKKVELSSQNVSHSNPFDALNYVEDDDDFDTNGRNLKSTRKRSLNVAHDCSSDTHIIEKINKLERQIFDGKLTFVDDDEKPLYKVVTKGK
uniref:Uncharacterized protein n=1 Tax=Tanacetum cinerariifolium TaxID=118510 RepID=A0A6L2L925_TANCI|nr:hypothetical protein [Tanacetum cinerariifolium]